MTHPTVGSVVDSRREKSAKPTPISMSYGVGALLLLDGPTCSTTRAYKYASLHALGGGGIALWGSHRRSPLGSRNPLLARLSTTRACCGLPLSPRSRRDGENNSGNQKSMHVKIPSIYVSGSRKNVRAPRGQMIKFWNARRKQNRRQSDPPGTKKPPPSRLSTATINRRRTWLSRKSPALGRALAVVALGRQSSRRSRDHSEAARTGPFQGDAVARARAGATSQRTRCRSRRPLTPAWP